MKRIILLAAILTALVLLTTCSEPIDFIEAVTTEVKIANDLFLEVVSITPTNNGSDINPGNRLVIEFDRPVSTGTISDSSIIIKNSENTPAVWSFDYNTANNSLYIYPEPYLDMDDTYTAVVTESLKGTDGSSLQGQYVWSFETGLYPAGSVVINDGDSWTSTKSISLDISINSEVTAYRFSDYDLAAVADLSSIVWTAVSGGGGIDTVIEDEPYSLTSTQDEPRRVYIQFKDGTGNLSQLRYDSIEVDEEPPLVTGFTLNSGDAYTPSLRPKLGFTVDEAYPLQWRQSSNGATWSTWQNLTPGTYSNLAAAYSFSSTTGTKNYYLEFKDTHYPARQVQDSVTLQIPTFELVTKGTTNDGKITVEFNPYNLPTGTAYNLYTTSAPDTDPGKYGQLVLKTESSPGVFDVKRGEPAFVWIRAYNDDTGGWGPFNPAPELCYSSDVTVVYNDKDETDVGLARTIKEIFSRNLPNEYEEIGGVMPEKSVTLLPQAYLDLDPKTEPPYPPENRIYGHPTVLTHGCSSGNLQADWNVAAAGDGVIVMGKGGLDFLVEIGNLYNKDLLPDAPVNIITRVMAGEVGETEKQDLFNIYNETSDVWSVPLLSKAFGAEKPTPELNPVQIINRYPVYEFALRYDPKNLPPDIDLLAQKSETDDEFNVIREGRFVMFGFDSIPDAPWSGWVYFVNLVSMMSK